MSSKPPIESDALLADSQSGELSPNQLLPPWAGLPILRHLASLKLTVFLLALAIILVFIGTIAQAQLSIKDVVDDFFRSPYVAFNFKLLFPPSFFPNLDIPFDFYIPFPGGVSIGMAMAVNLLAAHIIRFKVQARGPRLYAGLLIIALGLVVSTLVIITGMVSEGVQEFYFPWKDVWKIFLVSMVVLCGALIYGALSLRPDEKILRWGMFISAAALVGLLLWLVSLPEETPLSAPSMRILWQLAKGTAAGLVLLVGCQLVFNKRAGVVLLHAGVGLMMVNEILVGLNSHESVMQITEGEVSNYASDVTQFELAIIDSRADDENIEILVPSEMLKKGDELSDHLLPFDIEILDYQANSKLFTGRRKDKGIIATHGIGLRHYTKATRRMTGTDNMPDSPSVYIRLTKRSGGDDLGTYLVTTHQGNNNMIEVNDISYTFNLRYLREYKPYSVYLEDVRAVQYEGANSTEKYESDIWLINTETGESIKETTKMNNPIRYSGEAFYQSKYDIVPETSKEVTGLQIVRNDSWMVPYIGCMIVAVGMLAHFSNTLRRFLSRFTAMHKHSSLEFLKGFASIRILLPLSMLLLLGGWVASEMRTPSPEKGEIDLVSLGQIPLLNDGRVKPFDAYARDMLRIISKKSTFRILLEKEKDADPHEEDGVSDPLPASLWLLDLIANPEVGKTHRVIRLESLTLLKELGLEIRPRKQRYSYIEITEGGNRDKINEHLAAAKLKQEEGIELSQTDRKWHELNNRLNEIDVIAASATFMLVNTDDLSQAEMRNAAAFNNEINRAEPPFLLPIGEKRANEPDKNWETIFSAGLYQSFLGHESPALKSWALMILAYQDGKIDQFNEHMQDYHTYLRENTPANADLAKVNFESNFNRFNPYSKAEVFYVMIFVLIAFYWLTLSVLGPSVGKNSLLQKIFGSEAIYGATLVILAIAFLLHSYALGARMYISGRPPVTNLYSSAVFLGWGAILMSMVLEIFTRRGICIAGAAWIGFATLWVADYLALERDTLEVLRAVLDSQFWLATHVVCITFGYSVTYLAGVLGIFYVFAGILPQNTGYQWCIKQCIKAASFFFIHPVASAIGEKLLLKFDDPQRKKELAKMIYGTLCFALFFSFVGTVLGGLWGDDSWGRFWGWDTKENGALIIVLWVALVLHARWGGMVRERGLAVLAVAGNIVVTWSWFGVNELKVGLHSYGFTEGALFWIGTSCSIFLSIVIIGCLPISKKPIPIVTEIVAPTEE